ncbi:MAG: long-chain fatty acid--CoA ligase [Novosphingobium sp.]|nr:long-chain fatty acid--CoA ligase [Novosphingobium sp.]
MNPMQFHPLITSDLLEHAARFHGDREIVSLIDRANPVRLTWSTISERSRKLASALISLGVRQGDRVATLAWNDHRHLEAWYAISGIGAVVHTVNPRLFADQITYILNHGEAEVLIIDATLAAIYRDVASGLTHVRKIVVLADPAVGEVDLPSPYLRYEDLIGGAQPIAAWPRLDENAPSGLCYTSGTTGLPKGVLYTHRSTMLHSFAAALPDSMNLSARDVIYPIVPMFHANAWGLPYSAAMVGAKLIFSGRHLDAATITDFAAAEQATFSAGVPTIWKALLDHFDGGACPPARLKRLVVGGSAMPQALIDAFHQRHGIKVTHAWGMTETSPLGTISEPRQADLGWSDELRLRSRQGRPPFGVDLRIAADDGNPIRHDDQEAGRLQVKGHWIVESYFRSDASALTSDGWFDTGDIARIDNDGFMQITDRAKDIIKSGGEWISSVELENAAMAFEGVEAAAVIGVPHPKWDERPVLLLVPAAGTTVAKDLLMSHLALSVSKWWLPDAVIVVETLPMTATGKINKLSLRDQYAELLQGSQVE